MKILFLIALALIIVTLFRRMNRPPITILAASSAWEQRRTLAFDDFYSQYYASSGIPKDQVRSTLNMPAQILRIPAEQIRPEDALDDLRPGEMRRGLLFVRTMAESPVLPESTRAQLATLDLDLLTVDEFIRKFSQLGQSAESPQA